MLCAIIFQLLFQTYYLLVIFKTESYIRNQLLFHAFYLSDDRVRLKFCEPTVNGLYHSDLVHSFQVQRKISTENNRVAKKMRTYFEMGTDGHRFVCFQIGIS